MVNIPSLPAQSPAALAERAEQLPQQASAALTALAAMPRVCGIMLQEGKEIKWHRVVNREAGLYLQEAERIAGGVQGDVEMIDLVEDDEE